jgi:hypothetical protein
MDFGNVESTKNEAPNLAITFKQVVGAQMFLEIMFPSLPYLQYSTH